MNAYEVIATKPYLHVFSDGTPRCMTLADEILVWMADQLQNMPAPTTLETGYGLTTILMTMLAKQHRAIAPDQLADRRILDYCKQHDISAEALHFHAGFSEDILPVLKLREESLDMVLIDGGHGMPTPFVDYAYTFKQLKVGGYLIVDDIQLITGMLLKEFLRHAPEWKYIRVSNGKTNVFQKIDHTRPTSWSRQPYMMVMKKRVDEILAREGRSRMAEICLEPVLHDTQQDASPPLVPTNLLMTRIVVARLKALRAVHNIRSIALFGAGKHTKWLEHALAGEKNIPAIVAILDDAPQKAASTFALEPIAPISFDPALVDAILLSTDCHQKEMEARCHEVFGDRIPLVDLYEGLPPGPYNK